MHFTHHPANDMPPLYTCEWYRWMDARFGTTPPSPLHHDNRCPQHGAPHHRRRTA